MNLSSLISICKESYKQINKTKLLFKSKIEREKQKIEKILSKIKYNKFELVFILEKRKNYYKTNENSVFIIVENEVNKEMFPLDEKEMIVKL